MIMISYIAILLASIVMIAGLGALHCANKYGRDPRPYVLPVFIGAGYFVAHAFYIYSGASITSVTVWQIIELGALLAILLLIVNSTRGRG